jgi:Ion transport protein
VISLSTIFQSLTLEGWVFNMYKMMDAGQNISSPLYFLLIVIFGAFFLMNLILAAIMDSFSKVDKEMAVAEFKREFRGVEKQAQLTIMSKVKIVELMRKQKKFDERIIKSENDFKATQDMLMPPNEKFNLASALR